jgi:hypothetical protein
VVVDPELEFAVAVAAPVNGDEGDGFVGADAHAVGEPAAGEGVAAFAVLAVAGLGAVGGGLVLDLGLLKAGIDGGEGGGCDGGVVFLVNAMEWDEGGVGGLERRRSCGRR